MNCRGEVRKSDTRSPQFVSGSRELISEKVNFLRAHKRTPVMKYELDKGECSRGNLSFWRGKKGRSVASKYRLTLFALDGSLRWFSNYRIRLTWPFPFFSPRLKFLYWNIKKRKRKRRKCVELNDESTRARTRGGFWEGEFDEKLSALCKFRGAPKEPKRGVE